MKARSGRMAASGGALAIALTTLVHAQDPSAADPSTAAFCAGVGAAVDAASTGQMQSLAQEGAAAWSPSAEPQLAPPPFIDCASPMPDFEVCSLNSTPDGLAWTISRRVAAPGVQSTGQDLVTAVDACVTTWSSEKSSPPWPASQASVVRESWVVRDGAARVTVSGEIYGEGRGAVTVTVAPRLAEQEALRASSGDDG